MSIGYWAFRPSQARELACDEVLLVRYVGLVTNVDILIVGDDFGKVGDAFSAVGGVIARFMAFITDWDGFWSFPHRLVHVLRCIRSSYAWCLDMSTWRACAGRG